MIFNNFWNGICEETPACEEEYDSKENLKNSRPIIPISNKECAIWKGKGQKEYVMIFATITEEVIHHMDSINDSYSSLNILNEMYNTHSECEIIQLMVKLFNLELKSDNPMSLASKIESIMHDIDATRVKI
jgi:hypothetical protein